MRKSDRRALDAARASAHKSDRRVSISLSLGVSELDVIDAAAEAADMTRSAFMAEAAVRFAEMCVLVKKPVHARFAVVEPGYEDVEPAPWPDLHAMAPSGIPEE